MLETDLHVDTGALLALRLLDVADAIDLAQAENLWSAHAGRESRRTQLATASPNQLAFEPPPALLPLEDQEFDLGDGPVRLQMTARLYAFGAIAIAVRWEVSDLDWATFTERCNALHRAVGPTSQSPIWSRALAHVLATIAPALQRPTREHLEEDYLFAIVHRFNDPLTADDLRTRPQLATLLSGESRPLSSRASRELTAQAFSYFVDDLAVVTWDRAFIYEPRRDSDVIDIIEFANAQLLEMRYYDELLDQELSAMYDVVANTGSGLSVMASRRAARLARKLYGLVAEVTELTEKVENSLQVTEDVYLARIYAAALDLFRVPKLSAAVDRKLAIIRDTYIALYEEASSRRAEWLELAIVLLILFEIMLALARH